MFLKKPTFKQNIGKIGEDAAVKYFSSLGHTVIDRNYWKKWGEIDIVSRDPQGTLHFIEVKTVTRATFSDKNGYNAIENVHRWKRERLSRAIRTYLLEKRVGEDSPWQVDVAAVYLDTDKNLISIEVLDDVIL